MEPPPRLAQALESEWGRVALGATVFLATILLLASLVQLLVGVLTLALPAGLVLLGAWALLRPIDGA